MRVLAFPFWRYKLPLLIRDIDINRELFPNAQFFKSKNQLVDLLGKVKALSENDIQKRKHNVASINKDNLPEKFNYPALAEKFLKIIFD